MITEVASGINGAEVGSDAGSGWSTVSDEEVVVEVEVVVEDSDDPEPAVVPARPSSVVVPARSSTVVVPARSSVVDEVEVETVVDVEDSEELEPAAVPARFYSVEPSRSYSEEAPARAS